MSTLDKSIAIPDFSLVVLIGATGSGKSTFAAKHFLPSEVISSDHCRALISDSETDQSVTGDAFDLVREIAGKRLKNRKLAVIDATNIRPADRKGWIELAREWHALPVAIVLDPGIDICIARNRARPDRAFGAQVVQRMALELRRGYGGLQREGFRQVWKLPSAGSRRGGDRDAPAVVDRQTRAMPGRSTSSAIFMAAPANFSLCSTGLATRSHGATTAVSVPSP